MWSRHELQAHHGYGPIYRCWATMRLRDLDPWVRERGLPEMHAGVLEMGAVDAWMDVTAMLE